MIRLLASAIVASAIVAATCVADWRTWQEYYGDGPPYYGLTTNMDKWSDPLPFLMKRNGVAVALVGLVLAAGISCDNRRSQPGGHDGRSPRSAG